MGGSKGLAKPYSPLTYNLFTMTATYLNNTHTYQCMPLTYKIYTTYLTIYTATFGFKIYIQNIDTCELDEITRPKPSEERFGRIEGLSPASRDPLSQKYLSIWHRKVNIRLAEKGNLNSHGARPVY